jgi:hypothetical protein
MEDGNFVACGNWGANVQALLQQVVLLNYTYSLLSLSLSRGEREYMYTSQQAADLFDTDPPGYLTTVLIPH